MTNTPLGTEPPPDAQRDAIHQAIIPAVASQMLRPGQRVEVEGGTAQPAVVGHGIVDPYLMDVVPRGGRFWLCLLPGTVTGMRHHWSHPDFDVPPGESKSVVVSQKDLSKEWLWDFAERAGLGYCDMLNAAEDFLDTGRPFAQHDSESARDAFWDSGGTAFWDHFEVVTGKKVDDKESSPFCCAC